MAFARDSVGAAAAYDRKIDAAATRQAKLADHSRVGVRAADRNADAIANAKLIAALVTADQALAAAQETAKGIAPGALYCDMNSVAPQTKRAAAEVIERARGRYVDVAVMSPVLPGGRTVPLLLAGPHAEAGRDALAAAGFGNLRVLDGPVGVASSVKMIRSVMVKGLEALTAECVLAADAAGVLADVVASLNASSPGTDWATKADYNLDRIMVHGIRRADEMAEVVRTLDALGTGSAMSRATADRQRAIGQLGLDPGRSLGEKIDAIVGHRKDRAA